jgi:hypothetical protein
VDERLVTVCSEKGWSAPKSLPPPRGQQLLELVLVEMETVVSLSLRTSHPGNRHFRATVQLILVPSTAPQHCQDSLLRSFALLDFSPLGSPEQTLK